EAPPPEQGASAGRTRQRERSRTSCRYLPTRQGLSTSHFNPSGGPDKRKSRQLLRPRQFALAGASRPAKSPPAPGSNRVSPSRYQTRPLPVQSVQDRPQLGPVVGQRRVYPVQYVPVHHLVGQAGGSLVGDRHGLAEPAHRLGQAGLPVDQVADDRPLGRD